MSFLQPMDFEHENQWFLMRLMRHILVAVFCEVDVATGILSVDQRMSGMPFLTLLFIF